MKDKRLAERKKMQKSIVKHFISDVILNPKADMAVYKEIQKFHEEHPNGNDEAFERTLINIFKSDVIKVSDTTGYVVDKVGSNGKTLESYTISTKDVEKFYDIQTTENYNRTLVRKPLMEVEEDSINQDDIYDVVKTTVSYMHRAMGGGELEKVNHHSRIIVLKSELEEFEKTDFKKLLVLDNVDKEDLLSAFVLIKTFESLFNVYGGEALQREVVKTLKPVSIVSDFSRSYGLKRKYDLDRLQKMMVLNMFS